MISWLDLNVLRSNSAVITVLILGYSIGLDVDTLIRRFRIYRSPERLFTLLLPSRGNK